MRNQDFGEIEGSRNRDFTVDRMASRIAYLSEVNIRFLLSVSNLNYRYTLLEHLFKSDYGSGKVLGHSAIAYITANPTAKTRRLYGKRNPKRITARKYGDKNK